MVANGFEGVPWMVSGADHSANIARVLANAGTGGGAGVVSPTDLKVSASATPDRYVHVGVGAFVIPNKFANAQNESYVGRANQVSDLQLGLPGSTARSDLIVARIKDPQYPPYTGLYPANDPALVTGPFAFPEIIPGVPSNTVRAEQLNLAEPILALARIDWPANGTAITTGMIKDLRKPVQPRYLPFNQLTSGPAPSQPITTSSTDWINWPTASALVDIPEWATWADISIDLQNLGVDGPANVDTRVQFGTLYGSTYYIDYNGANPTYGTYAVETLQHSTAASLDVSSIAGTTVTMRLNAKRTFISEAPGTVLADAGTKIRFRVEFFERVR